MNNGVEKEVGPRRKVRDDDRITIGLTKRSAIELAEMHDETGMSKTDIVNRAIGLYRFVTEKSDEGWSLLVQNADASERFLVHLQ